MTLLLLSDTSNLDNIPEEFDGHLDCASLVVCCAFNRHGTLLAVGCNDGRIVVWDFLTRCIAKSILAHAGHPVSSISWSRNGQKIVSASLDNSIAIWEVISGNCIVRWTFNSPLTKVQFNPRNDTLVLVNAVKQAAILLTVDYHTKSIGCKILQTDKDDQDPFVVASFERRGQYIYTGNSKGKLTILLCPKITPTDIDAELQIVSSFKIPPTGVGPSAIREIEFGARNKNFFLVNSTDRNIRLYTCESALNAGINGNCEEVRRFHDIVNRTMWKRCCLSGDAEATHVCGGSARQHSLYIWETENGTIKKMLQGGKSEMLLDVQWHPHRPIVVSVSNGMVSVWARAQIENWSAYAPDFKELEENVEYEERESEFDVEDEDKPLATKENLRNDDDDVEIDVEAINPEGYVISSDEEGVDPNSLEFIPVTYEEYDLVDTTQATH